MCKFKIGQHVYDRNNYFGKGHVDYIDDDEKWIRVEFDDNNNQFYTFDGERIAQEATLQTAEEAFPFKVGDIVEDTTRKFGRGIVTQVDPNYITTTVTVQFDNNPKPQAYTADGRFYIGEPVTLVLIRRPFTFEVGDYVADSRAIEHGIGVIRHIDNNYTYPISVYFREKQITQHYTLDGRFMEKVEPTLILIRKDK